MSTNIATNHFNKFFNILNDALKTDTFVKLVLGKYAGQELDLEKIIIRSITIKDEPCLSFVYRYQTKDVTKNFAYSIAVGMIKDLLGSTFKNAHLLTASSNIQLMAKRRGKWQLTIGKSDATIEVKTGHNREKHRFMQLDRPFLTALGVTDKDRKLIPSMSRKWKQINKFLEVFHNAYAASLLQGETDINVVDFGSGKGYLTFAIHDYLKNTLHKNALVTGVELRDNLVALCNEAITDLRLEGLRIRQGDVRHFAPEKINVMIALHACDIATDYAIHMGIRSDADIIMCSPCCHKELRPQMTSPDIEQPMLKYGIHMGQMAEMVTDSMRALLLEANGYQTQVFEFVSLEHTSKNKMILAVKGSDVVASDVIFEQIQNIKLFYGIQEQCLERLLNEK